MVTNDEYQQPDSQEPTAIIDTTAVELPRVRQVGERVLAEFGALLRSFPFEVRTIAEVAEWLGVSPPICQRLMRSVRHKGDVLRAFTYLPGVQGLQQFVIAARRRGCDETLAAAAEAAWRQYSELIDAHGGRQVRLLEALKETQTGHEDDAVGAKYESELARKKVFEGVRQSIGREFETHMGLFIYRPSEQHPGKIICSTAMGMIGIRRRPGSLPICPGQTFFTKGDESDLPAIHDSTDDRPGIPIDHRIPPRILEEFCSEPPPTIVTRQEDERFMILVDPEGADSDPIDVMLHSLHPDLHDPRVEDPRASHSMLVATGPSRNLVLDVLFHSSLARSGIVSTGNYVVAGRPLVGTIRPAPDGSHLVDSPEARWQDRLPSVPRLEYLGPGLENLHTTAYPRMAELVSYLFDHHRWSPDEFIGYRCQVRYPLWNVQYLLSIDFNDPENAR